jgi:hypothetical protein
MKVAGTAFAALTLQHGLPPLEESIEPLPR